MIRPDEFSVTPEQATATSEAPWLTGPLQNLSSINSNQAKKNEAPLFIPFDVVFTAANQSQTCNCDSGIPDYWIVTVRPIASIKISIFLNSNTSGIPIRLSGGGYARLPGMSEFLTVVNENGSVGCNVTVVAIRGYKDVEIDGGDLA